MLISFPDMGSCLSDFFFLFLGSNMFNSPFLIYCYMRFHVKPYIGLNLGVLSLGSRVLLIFAFLCGLDWCTGRDMLPSSSNSMIFFHL